MDRLLIACRLKRPTVVVYIDGGICSQMWQYQRGAYYDQLTGIDVYWDIDWFNYCGKDMNGNHERIFELTTAFPTIPFRTLPRWKNILYRKFMQPNDPEGIVSRPNELKQSFYWGSYFLHADDPSYNDLFDKIFTPSNRVDYSKHLDKGGKQSICSVHVRRGDLVNADMRAYLAVSDNYFFEAVRYVQEKYDSVKFFFFSDEMDYVRKNLLPQINVDYELVTGNKAYEDLFLIAESDVIIASQGSFGKTAARLNPQAELVLCNDRLASRFKGHNRVHLV